METYQLSRVLFLTTLSFALALFLTPILLSAYRLFGINKNIRASEQAPLFNKLHSRKAGTPTMGGVLVWGSVLFLCALFWVLDRVIGIAEFSALNFVSRKETLLPLGAFLGASLVGLFDDWLDFKRKGTEGHGLKFRYKLWLYLLVAGIGAWWFYFKLGFSFIHIPIANLNIDLGFWFIPFFIFTVIATAFSVNQTDGLDGLAGGILLMSFFGFGLIAFVQGRYDLTAMLGAVCGSLLAFLWFNVFPAKFFMGDTGSMGMGTLLAVVAFLTNEPLLIPVIGFIFLAESLSTLIQIFSKKFLGKKFFLSSPIHHHFEAKGWPEAKVTMRFWIIASVTGILGVVIHFIK